MQLPSTKPYLLRALWEWCGDNGFTPHIVVQVNEYARVPREHVREGQIVLNIGQDATSRLSIGNEFIDFQARFGGVARDISVPVGQVLAIYARENGAGMAFEVEAPQEVGGLKDLPGKPNAGSDDAASTEGVTTKPAPSCPVLTRVK